MSGPYNYWAIQRNSRVTVSAAGVEIPVWSTEPFPSLIAATEAIAAFCGEDPETVASMDFMLLEVPNR